MSKGVTPSARHERPPGSHELTPDRSDPYSAELIDEWTAWSTRVGTAAQPIMEQLFERLPQVRASILCSADGFNLCALGVDEYQVSRLAALNSSLYAVSGAAVEASSGSPRPLDFVTLVSGGQLCVLIAIAHPTRGHLLLCASAEDVRLGGLLYEVRTTAERLARLLLTDSEPVDA